MWKIRQGSVIQSSAPPLFEAMEIGVERREEQHFEAMEIGSNEREREGQPFGEENNFYCVEGVLPPALFIGGGGGDPPL